MKQKITYFLSLFVLTLQFSFADSPLTSTDFYQAYQKEKIIIAAGKAKGKINEKLIKYLINNNNPVAIKMAIINRLGWDYNGKENAFIFFQYLHKKFHYASQFEVMNNAHSDIVLCLAYLKALDNYFDCTEALEVAQKACEKEPKSYTYQMIKGLIEAQVKFDSDWCGVYKCTNTVRVNLSLQKDMSEEASSIIFEYMDLYKADCKE